MSHTIRWSRPETVAEWRARRWRRWGWLLRRFLESLVPLAVLVWIVLVWWAGLI